MNYPKKLNACITALFLFFCFLLTPKSTHAATEIYHDNFDVYDTSVWEAVPSTTGSTLGNWHPTGGYLVQDASGDHFKTVYKANMYTSQVVETSFLHNPIAGYNGITFWYQDANNWVDIYCYPTAADNDVWVLETVEGITSLSTTVHNCARNVVHKVRVEADASSKSVNVYVDDVFVATHILTASSAFGYTGLNSGNGGGKFDYFDLSGTIYETPNDGTGGNGDDTSCTERPDDCEDEDDPENDENNGDSAEDDERECKDLEHKKDHDKSNHGAKRIQGHHSKHKLNLKSYKHKFNLASNWESKHH
ncbi:hypothetical protein KC980_00110 [candidate division WWE3 bacterium]|uniref:DUF642 domain-containing protein n=1 Tax=candidate division WWE3 bacterium TaxID=2053526 RepID=A0A955EAI1_UNCKA|nr:hypothetical protein [candidate division WWE3 bacterium]